MRAKLKTLKGPYLKKHHNMNRLSKRSKGRLDGVLPVLVEIFEEGIKTCPYDFGIPQGGGRRTEEDQAAMYAIGRTTQKHRKPVTWTLNSNHLEKGDGFGYAVDIYAYINGKASWNLKYLRPIANHLKKYAADNYDITLEWGHDLWGKDGAHFQIKYKGL